MNSVVSVTQKQLADFLLNVAITRPVFIWGPHGIGKSSLVQEFAQQVGLPCVSLLGSQLASEDILGVPQIVDGTSIFCPRPRWVPPPDWEVGRTFGIVLDTSGSMDRSLLAKALGAIASYSMSREVPAVRVVFCDAATYDQGYMRPEAIAEEVRVRGRGGTILQPAIDLLERAEDFPEKGPILIITDGLCDRLAIPPTREHAFLMPEGRSLPFVPRGPVFRIR